MHRRGVRQREAADQIGVSRATLCRLLAGKAPAVETYLRVKKWIET
ncbi:helix-turn-helix domain-containing protein [Sphingobium sp.]